MLLPLSVFADDNGMILFRGGVQTTGQSQNFQRSHLPAVIGKNESARPADGAQNIDDSGVRDRNDVAGLKNNIVGGVAAFHQLV